MPVNSQNKLVCSQSAWALDASTEFLTTEVETSWFCPFPGGQDPGELQNAYTTVHSNYYDTFAGVTGSWFNSNPAIGPSGSWLESNSSSLGSPGHGPLYNRRHTLSSIYSFVNASGPIIGQVQTAFLQQIFSFGQKTGSLSYPGWGIPWNSQSYPLGNPQLYGGNALFEAPRLASCTAQYQVIGRSPNWNQGGTSSAEGTTELGLRFSINPFYNSYADFNEDLRPQNSTYSIIPEFRISEWLPFYMIERGGDFLSFNPSRFEIEGITGSQKSVWISGKNNQAIEVSPDEFQNSSKPHFYKIFSNSDFMKHYAQIRTDHKDFVDPSTITLKCKALLKLLPYDGFYPSERTNQICQLASRSFGDEVGVFISGAVEDPFKGQQSGLPSLKFLRRPFYSALMSPGLLYNSIKSGMAIDYPVYTASFGIVQYKYMAPSPDVPYVVNTNLFAVGSGTLSDTEIWTRGFDYRIPFEALVDPTSYLQDVSIMDMEPQPDATYNYGFLPTNCMNNPLTGAGLPSAGEPYHLNPTNTWHSLKNKWSGKLKNDLYTMAMHNFLAETPDFFLKNSEFSSIKSAVQSEFDGVIKDRYYAMRIKMYRSMTQKRTWVSCFLGENGIPVIDFDIPQDSITFNGIRREEYLGESGFVGDENDILIPRENFTMYSRPSAFGPPVAATGSLAGGWSSGTAGSPTISGLNLLKFGLMASDSTNGFYCSYTPPYKDGEAWADIVFKAPRTGSPTIREIEENSMVNLWRIDTLAFGDVTPEVFYTEAGQRANTHSGTGSNGTVRQNAIWNCANFVDSDPDHYPMDLAGANTHAMQIDASLNLFAEKNNRWVIEPKWETPHFNFIDVDSGVGWTVGLTGNLPPTTIQAYYPPEQQTLSIPLHASESVPRGMWHQFGQIETDKGIYVEIGDIPQSWWNPRAKYMVSGHTFNPDAVFEPGKLRYGVPYQQGIAYGSFTPKSYYGAGTGSFSTSSGSPYPESLADKLTMKGTMKLGNTAEAKIISEAVVAVPFLIENGERKFFKIPEEIIRVVLGDLGVTTAGANAVAAASAAAAAANDGLQQLVDDDQLTVAQQAQAAAEAAAKAAADAITTAQEVTPKRSIVDMVSKMRKYIFPPTMDFVTNLGKVAPFAMYIFEFEHKLTQCELSKIWQNVAPDSTQKIVEREAAISHELLATELMGNFIGDGREAMKDKVQWMVFKVKRRANNNYFSKTAKYSRNSVKRKQSDYSYNWPYDYFSLIECANIEATVGFGTEVAVSTDENTSTGGTSELLSQGIQATAAIPDPLSTLRGDINSLTASERAEESRDKRKEKRQEKNKKGPFGDIKTADPEGIKKK